MIYFFSAPWCPQCKVIKPKFIDLCQKYNFTDYQFIDVETPEGEALSSSFSVRNLPTAIFLEPFITDATQSIQIETQYKESFRKAVSDIYQSEDVINYLQTYSK